MIIFEWDNKKRIINLDKHAIDFIDAVEIFDDLNRIEIELSAKDETRYQTIGLVNNVVLFVVYTYRKENIRIISARRASKNERMAYHEENSNEK